MKTQIKNYSTKFLLTAAFALGILTVAAFAQKPDGKTDERGQIHRQTMRIDQKTASANGERKAAPGATVSSNGETFQNGKDFTMAMYDADAMNDDDDALNYTILDLVYLIDRLEGQPEAAQLQKTLKSVLRGTSNGALVKKDIETVSLAYFNRQKPEQKWYYGAGKTTMNLMIASYAGANADVKKGLTDLQALTKTAPKTALDEILNPMKALAAKYAATQTFADEDYTAIYQGASDIIDLAAAA